MTSYTGEERRKPVDAEKEIKDLLMQATDPVQKALALILLKVSDAVDHNTAVTSATRSELQTHMEDEMKLMNQGKGGIKVGLLALGIIQVLSGIIVSLVLYAGSEKLKVVESLQYDMLQTKIFIAEHKMHHQSEEASARK